MEFTNGASNTQNEQQGNEEKKITGMKLDVIGVPFIPHQETMFIDTDRIGTIINTCFSKLFIDYEGCMIMPSVSRGKMIAKVVLYFQCLRPLKNNTETRGKLYAVTSVIPPKGQIKSRIDLIKHVNLHHRSSRILSLTNQGKLFFSQYIPAITNQIKFSKKDLTPTSPEFNKVWEEHYTDMKDESKLIYGPPIYKLALTLSLDQLISSVLSISDDKDNNEYDWTYNFIRRLPSSICTSGMQPGFNFCLAVTRAEKKNVDELLKDLGGIQIYSGAMPINTRTL